jgi:hypothetical protein
VGVVAPGGTVRGDYTPEAAYLNRVPSARPGIGAADRACRFVRGRYLVSVDMRDA